MDAFVNRSTGGHRARPKWTVHAMVGVDLSSGWTMCGWPAPRAKAVEGGRPQGEVKVCSRCYSVARREEIEARVNPRKEIV